MLGPIVRVPVMVRVGDRMSAQGGNDIDVVKALERARSEAITDRRELAAKAEKQATKRTEWFEELDA